MRNSVHTGRGKMLAAVTLSLVLHSSLGVVWFAVRPSGSTATIDIATAVEGPNDREMVITLKEPPSPIIAKPTPIEPRKLLANMEGPSVSVPSVPVAPAEVVQAGGPPKPGPNKEPSTATKPLHGKLKAGKTIAYAIDCSSSMGSEGQLRAACQAVKASLLQLNAEAHFQIVAYNGSTQSLSNRPLLATEAHRERAHRWLDSLVAEGRSDHLAGLREALWQQPDVVILLTDADDLDAKDVKAIRGIIRDRVLCTRLFGSGLHANDTPLRKLCEATGGDVLGR